MGEQGTFRALLGVAGAGLCVTQLVLQAPAAAQAEPRHSTPAIAAHINGRAIAPDLFGTVALPARISRYADGWFQSRRDASGHPGMQQLIAPARNLPREQQMAFVQRAVHQRIRWMSDATEWGAHDYWASAAETLDRGAGDMEDRAIVKLQALKALGFPGSDLYLTMGRDKVGGPITVLVVRIGNRHFVLDDLGGAPVQAEAREGFEPMLSFGSNTVWLHGRRAARTGGSAPAAK